MVVYCNHDKHWLWRYVPGYCRWKNRCWHYDVLGIGTVWHLVKCDRQNTHGCFVRREDESRRLIQRSRIKTNLEIIVKPGSLQQAQPGFSWLVKKSADLNHTRQSQLPTCMFFKRCHIFWRINVQNKVVVISDQFVNYWAVIQVASY